MRCRGFRGLSRKRGHHAHRAPGQDPGHRPRCGPGGRRGTDDRHRLTEPRNRHRGQRRGGPAEPGGPIRCRVARRPGERTGVRAHSDNTGQAGPFVHRPDPPRPGRGQRGAGDGPADGGLPGRPGPGVRHTGRLRRLQPARPPHPRRPRPRPEPRVVRGDRPGLQALGHPADHRDRQGPLRRPVPHLHSHLPPGTEPGRPGRGGRHRGDTGLGRRGLAHGPAVPRRRVVKLPGDTRLHRHTDDIPRTRHELDGAGRRGPGGPGRPHPDRLGGGDRFLGGSPGHRRRVGAHPQHPERGGGERPGLHLTRGAVAAGHGALTHSAPVRQGRRRPGPLHRLSAGDQRHRCRRLRLPGGGRWIGHARRPGHLPGGPRPGRPGRALRRLGRLVLAGRK